jgi:carboxyl-terminal processing protease
MMSLRVLFCLIMLVLSGCSGGSVSETGIDPWVGFTLPDPADYSTLTWTDAFKAAHDKFSREYAFSAWKGVDWPGLYSRFLPRIERAQAARDEKAYYLTLYEYIFSTPDGHISLVANDPTILKSISQERVGGGFGLAVAELDDWRVVAAAVVSNGPADKAGIAPGAEIVPWGGLPVLTAIGRIDRIYGGLILRRNILKKSSN